LFRLAYTAAFTLVLAFGWTQLSLRKVSLGRRVQSARGQVGEEMVETLSLVNGSRLPKVWLGVQDLSTLPDHDVSRVVSTSGRKSVRWEVRTMCHQRGRFQLGPAVLRAGDPFGLFEKHSLVGEASAVVIYPATVPLPGLRLPGGALLGGTNRRRHTDQITPNAAGVREYVPGDSLSRVHWLTSARMNRLMVKEFEPDPIADLWIALDMDAAVHVGEGRESTEEYAVHAAASIARHFLMNGWAVGLLSLSEQHHDIPPERGDRQMIKMLEELAVIRATGHVSLAEMLISEGVRFGRYATVVTITPSVDEGWGVVLGSFIEQGVRSMALLVDASSFGGRPAPSTDLLAQQVAKGVTTYTYRKGDSLASVLASEGAQV
ncbi:MAG: DUF58 domain-containing protein, partial [Chloroflexota bacterium]